MSDAHGLLERGEELRRIRSALARGAAGTGSLLVIEGPAGIGKTALLSAARAGAEAAGMQVLAARGAELEREFAFGVVRQLLEPPLAQASAEEGTELLQGPAGLAAEALALPGFSASRRGLTAGPEPPFAVLHGLYWLCANLAATCPTCLIVDDAHWADAPRCASWPSCCRAWRGWARRWWWRPAPRVARGRRAAGDPGHGPERRADQDRPADPHRGGRFPPVAARRRP